MHFYLLKSKSMTMLCDNSITNMQSNLPCYFQKKAIPQVLLKVWWISKPGYLVFNTTPVKDTSSCLVCMHILQAIFGSFQRPSFYFDTESACYVNRTKLFPSHLPANCVPHCNFGSLFLKVT